MTDKTNASLKGCSCENDGTPYDNREEVIINIPVALPISSDATTKTGGVYQGTYDTIKDIDPAFSPFWLSSIGKHDSDLQTLPLNDKTVKYFAPKIASIGHAYVDSTFVPNIEINEGDPDLEDDVDTISNKRSEIAKQSISQRLEEEFSLKSPRQYSLKSPLS